MVLLARLGALVGLALLGCMPAADPAPGSSSALTNASEHDGDPAVVAIVSTLDPSRLRCTGTLIGERVVLTAAHCGVQHDRAAFEVVLGFELGAPGTAILEANAHPSYDDSADHDLALLLLAAAAPVAPVALRAEPIAGDPPIAVRLVGFGRTRADATDEGRKREGAALVTSVMTEHVVLGADPALPCNGDSGGPVFLDAPSGERLAAVISRGDAECSSIGRATRVDTHLESFVRPQLDAWAPSSIGVGGACLYDAHCASSLCVEALDEPAARFCSRACARDDDCERPTVCDAGLCRHPLPSPGAIGAPCGTHDDCAAGDCLDTLGLCSVRCVVGRDDCPSSFRCERVRSVDFFCVPEPEPTGGCGVAGSQPPPHALVPLMALLAAFLLAIRRRLFWGAPPPARAPWARARERQFSSGASASWRGLLNGTDVGHRAPRGSRASRRASPSRTRA